MRILLAALALTGAALTGCGATSSTSEPVPLCASEDSVNCYWDAGSQGNGTGRSFAAWAMPDGTVLVLYTSMRFSVVG